ncbi:hypothetical protein RRF57_008742 [Xylaria bambusicola]|uniref:Uncharacterized protein n=1 Tax=Xylaria bambusicola TaxID=326684 RepID=A0AAN7UYI4_9PEZI
MTSTDPSDPEITQRKETPSTSVFDCFAERDATAPLSSVPCTSIWSALVLGYAGLTSTPSALKIFTLETADFRVAWSSAKSPSTCVKLSRTDDEISISSSMATLTV